MEGSHVFYKLEIGTSSHSTCTIQLYTYLIIIAIQLLRTTKKLLFKS